MDQQSTNLIKGNGIIPSPPATPSTLPLPDTFAGDGTTTIVVITDSLLYSFLILLSYGIHLTTISNALHKLALHTINNTNLIHGLIFDKKSIDISDYTQMNRIIREEHNRIRRMVKHEEIKEMASVELLTFNY